MAFLPEKTPKITVESLDDIEITHRSTKRKGKGSNLTGVGN